MSPRVQQLAILLATVIAVNAAPLPGPGGYGTKGSPAFFQGTWEAITGQGFITTIAGQGSVSQVLQNDSIVTVVTTYDSYDCINPFTFRVEGSVTYLPSKLSGRWCGLVFNNGTNLVIKAASVLIGACPDSLLPPAAPGEVIAAYTQVLGIVPPPSANTCTTPGFVYIASPPPLPTTPPSPTMSPSPTSSPSTKPSKVNLLPSPGSAQAGSGLWKEPGVFMMHSVENMCATRYEDGILRFQIGQFISYQCTGPNTFYQTFNLTQYDAFDLSKPTLGMTDFCLSAARNTVDNTLTVWMSPFGPCPASVQNGPDTPGVVDFLVLSLISPVPGNPNTTCENISPPSPPPTPSPSPSPSKSCTYKGTWTISPLLSPCNKQRFAFKPSACATNTNVTLSTAQQLGSSAKQQSTFGLDHSWTSKSGAKSNIITAIRDSDCMLNELTGPSDGGTSAPTLELKKDGLKWSIVPLGNDCTSVNLVSASGKNKGKYLQVVNKCQVFSWGTKDSAGARFKLSKLSELS